MIVSGEIPAGKAEMSVGASLDLSEKSTSVKNLAQRPNPFCD